MTVVPPSTSPVRVSATPCWLSWSTPGQRLVQHQHVGLGRERPGDQRAPLLPARQRRHPAAPVVDQPDGGDGGVDRVAVGLAHRLEAPEPRQPARGDDLAHRRGQGPRGTLALGHVAEPVPLAEARRRYPEQLERSTLELGQTEDALHQGGLAGPVGTDQRDDLSRIDGEAGADHRVASVADDAVVQPQDRRHDQRVHGHGCPRWRLTRLARMTDR